MAKNKYHDYLKQVPMFASLDRRELDAVASATTDIDVAAGTALMREGHTGRELIIVVEGTLEVTRGGDHLADIGTGGFAGELALIGRTTRNATVATKTDASLIHIDGRDFDKLINEIPEIAVKMLPIIAARVSGADDHDHGSGIPGG
jgi:CRP-like cAMP-binding protein